MRIRWTPEEQLSLIEETAQVLFIKNALSLREAFNKAQLKLPVHRRREIAALSQVPWLTDAVPKRLAELKQSALDSVEKRIIEAHDAAVAKGAAEFEEKLVSAAGDFLAKVLISALKHPELALVFYRQPETEESNVSPNVRLQTVVKAVRQKKAKVIVAGVLNGQAKKLEESFKDKLDIRFWTKDQSTETLRGMLKQADAAIGMVGFLAHSHDGILKASNVPYYPISGGVTAIRQKLEQL